MSKKGPLSQEDLRVIISEVTAHGLDACSPDDTIALAKECQRLWRVNTKLNDIIKQASLNVPIDRSFTLDPMPPLDDEARVAINRRLMKHDPRHAD